MSTPREHGTAAARPIHSGSLRAQLAEERAARLAAEAGLAAVMEAYGGESDMPPVWPVALASTHPVVKLPGERVVVLRQSRAVANPLAEWEMLMNATGWRER